jgi:hypothetical protein
VPQNLLNFLIENPVGPQLDAAVKALPTLTVSLLQPTSDKIRLYPVLAPWTHKVREQGCSMLCHLLYMSHGVYPSKTSQDSSH